MRKKWFAFGCLTSFVLVIVFLLVVFHSLGNLGKKKAVKIEPSSFLELKLSGEIRDYNEFKDDFFSSPMQKKTISANDVVLKINKAAKDKNISGIILEPNWIKSGFATVNEIISALENFKATGKKVYAYLEMCGNKDYYLASVADSIYLNPSASAGILLTGIGGNILFYKELLDKLGIEMQVIHAGKYKGAGEPFSRNQMSEPFKESVDELFSDLYEQMLKEISRRRNIPYSQVKKIYEKRDDVFINKQNAIDLRIADELAFKEAMLEKLNINKKNLVKFSDYRMPIPSLKPDKIAVIFAQGGISQSKSELEENISAAKFNKILDKLEEDKTVKAVVMRVNSPGGSALESEIILNKIKALKKKKPFVISMGNVAASGGYYISCDADYIVADPFTITGSIGVIGMFPNFNKLGTKIGIHSNVIKKGKYSTLFDPWQKPDKSVLKNFESEIKETYAEFKNRVAEGRKLKIDKVEEIAQGRVWSSSDAFKNQLIDAEGTLDDAVRKAAELAGISSYGKIFYPKQKSFFELLLKEKFNIEIFSGITNSEWEKELKFKEALQFYEMIKNDPVQAIVPADLELK